MFGAQCPGRHARLEDRAFEVVHFVDTHAERGLSGLLRLQMNFSRAFENAIDIVSKLMPVINGGRVIPGIERVKLRAVEKDLLRIA